MEIWKDIEGYEGLYQVSNLGRVKSLKFNKEKILKLLLDSKGYYKVNLYKNNKIKTYLMHRLIASAFISNPNNLPQVNHKDEDKTNNKVENLEWCTVDYNINYGTRTEKTQKPILQFTKDGEFVKKWSCIKDVERELGFYRQSISKCCLGKRKTAYGFKWHYHYKSIWQKKSLPQIKKAA